MAEAARSRERLDAECQVFAKYLTGQEPTSYIREWYLKGHSSLVGAEVAATPLDELLLEVARRGPGWTGLAESYARWSCPNGLLRHKLILLLALMEHEPLRHRHLTDPLTGSRWAIGTRLAALGVRFVLLHLGAILMIGPRHLGLRLRQDRV